MALIAKTLLAAGRTTLAATTLGASDTFVYAQGDVLYLHNPTAGALSPTLDGDASAPFPVPGFGTVDPSAGYAVGAIPAGARIALPLDGVSRYLAGTVAVTGGTGLVAWILNG